MKGRTAPPGTPLTSRAVSHHFTALGRGRVPVEERSPASPSSPHPFHPSFWMPALTTGSLSCGRGAFEWFVRSLTPTATRRQNSQISLYQEGWCSRAARAPDRGLLKKSAESAATCVWSFQVTLAK